MAGGTQRAAVPVGNSQLVSFSSTPSRCPPGDGDARLLVPRQLRSIHIGTDFHTSRR